MEQAKALDSLLAKNGEAVSLIIEFAVDMAILEASGMGAWEDRRDDDDEDEDEDDDDDDDDDDGWLYGGERKVLWDWGVKGEGYLCLFFVLWGGMGKGQGEAVLLVVTVPCMPEFSVSVWLL